MTTAYEQNYALWREIASERFGRDVGFLEVVGHPALAGTRQVVWALLPIDELVACIAGNIIRVNSHPEDRRGGYMIRAAPGQWAFERAADLQRRLGAVKIRDTVAAQDGSATKIHVLDFVFGRGVIEGAVCDRWGWNPERDDLIFTDPVDGATVFNAWAFDPFRDDGTPTLSDAEEAALFAALDRFIAEQIAPGDEEREWLLKRVAHKLRHPAIPGVATLMIAANTYGVGRGVFFELLEAAFGPGSVTRTTQSALLGSPYHVIGLRSLLTIIPEMGGGAWESLPHRMREAERLKEIIEPAPHRQMVNIKFGPQIPVTRHDSLLIASNNEAAMPIERGDRRVTVIANATTPLVDRDWGPDFLARLFDPRTGWLRRGGGNRLRYHLRRYFARHYDAAFDPCRPLETEAKRLLTDASRGGVEQWVEETVADVFAAVKRAQELVAPEWALRLRGACTRGLLAERLAARAAAVAREAKAGGMTPITAREAEMVATPHRASMALGRFHIAGLSISGRKIRFPSRAVQIVGPDHRAVEAATDVPVEDRARLMDEGVLGDVLKRRLSQHD